MTDWTSLLTIEHVDAFGAGVYVLMAVIHLDLWLHRRDRPTHLWLAMSALGALLVNITGPSRKPDSAIQVVPVSSPLPLSGHQPASAGAWLPRPRGWIAVTPVRTGP